MSSKADFDVLVLAAGFGNRLKPLTDQTPKPLIEVGGIPMIDRCLARLSKAGATSVIINLHYLGEKIASHVGDGSKWGLAVQYSREDPILDTGGAVRHAAKYFQHDSLVVMNSDIVLGDDFSLAKVLATHRATPGAMARGAMATLVVREDPAAASYGPVDVDASGRVVGFLGTTYHDAPVVGRYMFVGVSVLSKSLRDSMPADGAVFSLTQDSFVAALAAGETLQTVVYEGYWNDVGTHDRLQAANRHAEQSQP